MKLHGMIRASATLLVLLAATMASSADKPKPGTAGTATSYEADKTKVIHVEGCTPQDNDFDYVPCVRVLREVTVEKICKRGSGTYKWWFQVGDEKSMLNQSTTCK